MVFGKGTKVELDWSVLERIAEYYEFPSAVFFLKDTDAFPEKTRNAASALKFHSSFLPRTNEAEREMCAILGLPVPKVSDTIIADRKAAGQRLKQAREVLPKPKDSDLLLEVPGAAGTPSTARGVYLLKWITETGKKGITMEALAQKHEGRPTHAAVSKLIELGLVRVKK